MPPIEILAIENPHIAATRRYEKSRTRIPGCIAAKHTTIRHGYRIVLTTGTERYPHANCVTSSFTLEFDIAKGIRHSENYISSFVVQPKRTAFVIEPGFVYSRCAAWLSNDEILS